MASVRSPEGADGTPGNTTGATASDCAGAPLSEGLCNAVIDDTGICDAEVGTAAAPERICQSSVPFCWPVSFAAEHQVAKPASASAARIFATTPTRRYVGIVR